ncbi:hypothetical protein OIU74_028027 [Salix koriyanagi]|uniref:Uncharacterized protein n=1 Tax=Salix koriyanagi TaxID=2511006 RepID=A0A9Q0VAM4_9ROSI|nr:hypothetical protein OIU74_028027 [Salix koriyanagi]
MPAASDAQCEQFLCAIRKFARLYCFLSLSDLINTFSTINRNLNFIEHISQLGWKAKTPFCKEMALDRLSTTAFKQAWNQSDHLKMNFSYTLQEMPQRRCGSKMVGGLDELSRLNELRGYESTEEEELMLLCFPHLSSLTISNFPNLTSMLFPTLDDVLHLYYTSSAPLQQTMKMRGWRSPSSPVSSSSALPLSNLKELYIWSIEDLESLPEIEMQNLSSFRLLSIYEGI